MKISQYNQVISLASGDKIIATNETNTSNNYITYGSLYSQINSSGVINLNLTGQSLQNQINLRTNKTISEIRNDGLIGATPNTLLTGWSIGRNINSGTLAIPASGVIYVYKTGEYLLSVYGRGNAAGERSFTITSGSLPTNAGQLTGLGIVGANYSPRTATDSAIVSILNSVYLGCQSTDNNSTFLRLRVQEL